MSSDNDGNDADWFGLAMNYSKISNTPLEQSFDTPIIIVLMAIQWQLAENKKEEQRIKQWKAQH